MHELSIAESMVDIVLRHAGEAGATKVTSVRVLIGELSTFVDESIELYWRELTRGTVAEGARLEFQREAGTLLCLSCSKEFPVHTPEFLCPHCGSAQALPSGGRECYVESIEVEPGG
jgi:hydrogenase nickel incorporation protein HypA/HybF